MLRMLEAQAPAKQTATDTISTLSGRLTNGTLLEDRRAAILGLRSFAKDYPASVASDALRPLIGCLVKDSEDIDTTKVVLETLLALFEPSETSLEASEDIALWLADEFSQRQDNTTILLDLLDKPDFYSRFYSLRLLQAIFTSREERTQESILTAPLGTTRLVATLDDPRDGIRNTGLRLLCGLTETSPELQKLVAFENAFDRIFALMEADGSLLQGGIVVQDCLTLLHNLIRDNTANQSLFRESGGIAQLSSILPGGPKKKTSSLSLSPEGEWMSPESSKNVWGLLSIMRLFLIPGSISTQPNQLAFHKHGITQQVLELAFDKSSTLATRAEALNTCADIIRGNARLQEGFGQYQVTPIMENEHPTNGAASPVVTPKLYVIEALLELALLTTSNSLFGARFAACECIKAYFHNHHTIKLHFLQRAVSGHTSGEYEPANVLSTLVSGPSASKDPYRVWFAAVLVLHLIYDDLEAKNIVMNVVEGNAENGEEVVTYIQTLAGHMVTALKSNDNERVCVAYLMLLSGWLFEAAPAVDDFLNEGSTLQTLIQTASRIAPDNVVRRGLCACLLGTIYEFSTKDSPIARRDLQPVLTSRLGRERYLSAVNGLRKHPLIRDFEVLPMSTLKDSNGTPTVLFDTTFVEFLKDNFSRLARAIDRDPGLEVHITHNGVDRDLVDVLRSQLEEKNQALQKTESDLLSIESKLNQERADHKRTQESSTAEINRVKSLTEAIKKSQEQEQARMEAAHERVIRDMEAQYKQATQQMQVQIQKSQREGSEAVEKAKRPLQDEITTLKQAKDEQQQKLSKANEEKNKNSKAVQELQQLAKRSKEEHTEAQTIITSLKSDLRKKDNQIDDLKKAKVQLEASVEKGKSENDQLRTRSQDQIWAVKDAEEKIRKAEQIAKDKEEARSKAQGELDDMLMVLADIEEKRTKDKARLKELGEQISDDEDEDDDEEEEEEDPSDVD
ncbi:intracellular protein transport protein [Pseudovirgaria hyperparasitica]|uniref:Intracellular protein transport protein n=1 Tax=Pseudovirgaria hyperparasitica TaxID=470096 RepID=A0A6A6W689_9PEZI|nr:intracellular protein transport protein [Pseudovirgaria hyperparasitica]KAF2758392.1 intracellular protein transport protein [Pseudovirgaria hyperparasitica]